MILQTLISLTLCAFAQQTDAEKFARVLEEHRVELQFTYELHQQKGRGQSGEGSIVYQDKCLRFESGGVVLLCDGSSTYTLLPLSRELIMEPVKEFSASAPDQLFEAFGLNPKKADIQIQYDRNGLPSVILATIKNQGSLLIQVNKAQLLPKKAVSGEFAPDLSAFDSSWVITDLR